MKTQNQVRITNQNARITNENVQHIGECIALSAIKKMMRFAHHPRSLDKLYAGLVEDVYGNRGYDGKTSIVRLKYARAAYQSLRIAPHTKEWWLDPVAFRQTNSWIAYTTAGYFLFKLRSLYGKEKLLQLAKYQTFEDACRIYGEAEITKLISEVEEEISNLGTGNP